MFVFFQAEDGIRDLVRSRGLGDVYKRQASNRLTAEYAGRTLLEIRTRLVAALQEEKVRFDAEIARALELARQAFVDERTGGETLVVEGAGTILEKPEFQNDVESLRRMYRALEEEARLVDLLTDLSLIHISEPTRPY